MNIDLEPHEIFIIRDLLMHASLDHRGLMADAYQACYEKFEEARMEVVIEERIIK